MLSTNVLGQDSGFEVNGTAVMPSSSDPGNWLQRAREAMKSENFLMAEQCIQMAEKAMSPGVVLQYTPAMAKQELAMLRQSNQSVSASAAATKSEDGQLSDGQQHLFAARRSLAMGDVAAAKKAIQLARQSQTDFSALGDSPEQLEAMVERQNQLVAMYQQGSADSGYDVGAAKFLMEQAEMLYKYQDFETSKMLVEQASTFTTVDFSKFETSPERMLTIIGIASQQLGGSTKPDVKVEVSRLMAQAQLAASQNNWSQAKDFVTKAKSYNLSDDRFANGETRPWQLEMTIDNALNLQTPASAENGMVKPASFDDPAVPAAGVAQAKYDPASDKTRVVPVTGVENDTTFNPVEMTPPPTNFQPVTRVAQAPKPAANRGAELYQSGVAALAANDEGRAREFFQLAMNYQDGLDAPTQTAIRTQLNKMEAAAKIVEVQPKVAQTSASDEEFGYGIENNSEFAKLQSEVFRDLSSAERMMEKEPREALQKMTMLRTRIASSQLAAETSRPLLKMVDRKITSMQTYIEKNLSQIQNQEEVIERREAVARTRQRREDVDQQLNKLVDDYNKLMDEERYAEADLVVRQAEDLAPNSEIAAVLREKRRASFESGRSAMIRREKEESFQNSVADVQRSTRPWDGNYTVEFDPDREGYVRRVQSRAQRLADGQYSSETDRMIWNKLKNVNVEGEYRGTLAEAMDQLSRQAGLNIVFDTMALEAANVTTDQMVNAPIRNPISLESALNVILSGVGLEFSVEDEVVKVTSRESKQTELKQEVYYVGDLLAPMKGYKNPNRLTFLEPGMNNGYNAGSMNVGNVSPSTINANASQIAMAQQLGSGGAIGGGGFGNFGGQNGYNNGPQRGTPMFGTINNQPQGGITQADFQQLIQLIQDTISNTTWSDFGGEGTIQSFPPNLSLIVTQSQKVQDEIRDLLKKLRDLNDVQIVIEVRFVAIQDNFFERIGVDFDFAINDNSGLADPTIDTVQQSTVVGNAGTGGGFIPTANQDIEFNQGSFGIATPQFGGFDLGSAANFGFAILSDIEVFFLLQAAKGSTRANVTEAPTVTLFNGQSASVSDFSSRPFVTSVTPVVGDFAVAHQPVITILPDGTNLDVTATVSADRRSVNMALVPFFSEVTEVTTFQFTGSTQTERSTNSLLDDLLDTIDPTNADASDDEFQTTTEGVTIQLPVIASTQVNTVVSVPDGGTVLMGGIKRMREQRIERGVPMLSSIPYVNRLFTNVGVSRETTNLMMMVTPRIIIQSEEEKKQIGVFGDE
jgi:general secretion pathway protein D